MPRKHWIALLGIAFSAFIMNTSEFMPIGLLVDIAAGFSMSEADAGYMVAIYAWAVAIFSVPLVVIASRFGMKNVLIACIALFAVGQIASAAAPTFELLIAARLIVAAGHAVFWSIATPLAARVVGERYSDMAIGVVVTGSSVAMVCGLPLGRTIGLIMGWRMTFLCVALVALATLAYLAIAVPRLGAGRAFSARDLPALVATPPLRDIYLVTALFATAHFTCYSYIEPFLQQVAGFSDDLITITLMLYGVAGIVGSTLFSRGYARLRFPLMRTSVVGVAAAMALLLVASANAVTAVIVCALWGAFYTSYNVVFQSEILSNTSEENSAVAMSAYSGIFNLGIGSGAWMGGLVTSTAGLADIGIAGAAFAAGAFALCSLRLIATIKRAESTNATV